MCSFFLSLIDDQKQGKRYISYLWFCCQVSWCDVDALFSNCRNLSQGSIGLLKVDLCIIFLQFLVAFSMPLYLSVSCCWSPTPFWHVVDVYFWFRDLDSEIYIFWWYFFGWQQLGTHLFSPFPWCSGHGTPGTTIWKSCPFISRSPTPSASRPKGSPDSTFAGTFTFHYSPTPLQNEHGCGSRFGGLISWWNPWLQHWQTGG